MRIRRIITGISVIAGIVAAVGGFLAAWQTDDMFVGTVWMIVGIGLMAGGTIYSMAMDDPEARAKALATHRGHTVDLRDPLEAPVRREREASTRVSV
jgi:hypothetical protein